jgi:hypothetical protein
MSNKAPRNKARRRSKAQAVVEMALMSLLLALLLAGVVDFGRAYYTDVVVTNMAAEGAAYASLNPDYDRFVPGCSNYPVPNPPGSKNDIQDRASLVAQERGLVIHNDNILTVASVPDSQDPYGCTDRCFNRTIRVKVTYTITDLFLPHLLGMNSITISESASQQIQRDADKATGQGCATGN